MRLLFKLLVAGLIARAVWQIGPVYWDYTQFKDAAQSAAQFAGSGAQARSRAASSSWRAISPPCTGSPA